MSDFTVGSFFAILGFYFLWAFIVLLIWHFLWLRPFPLSLPNPLNSGPPFKISNVVQALHYIYSLFISSFSAEFWLKNSGFEAFSYLCFIRQMLKMVTIFFILSFLFGVPFSLCSSPTVDIMNSFDLNNDLYKNYFQMVFLIGFSGLFFMSLYSLKKFLEKTLREHKLDNPQIYNLQEKTLRLKGVSKACDAEILKKKISETLPENEKGTIVDIIMIPNTGNMLNLECKRQEILLKKNYMRLKERDLENLQKIDEEIDIIKGRGYVSSGNAIVCVDSAGSFKYLLERFALMRIPFWKNLCLKLRMRCTSCYEYCPRLNEELLSKEEHEGILAYQLPSPEDISWKNLNHDSSISSLKRFGLNLLAVLFMIFFTTPASMITVLGLTELINAIIQDDSPEPGTFSNILEKNLSPLLIILINQLLLFIINTLAFMKKHVRISKTQITIFNTCFVYLLFNSFIIPALSMTTIESIFSFLSEESGKVEELLETFYLNNTGSLFVILLIQSGVFSFTLYILQLPDLFLNFFSRNMVVSWREERLKQEVWRKDEKDNFQFGYFYAINVVFLIIILVFSTTVPAISLSGIIYFLFRGVCDTWELISCHNREINSNGRFIDKVISFCCFGGIFFEVLMVIYYSVSQLKYNVIVMVLVLLASIMVVWKIESIEIEKRSRDDIKAEREEIRVWRKNYQHPLIELADNMEDIIL